MSEAPRSLQKLSLITIQSVVLTADAFHFFTKTRSTQLQLYLLSLVCLSLSSWLIMRKSYWYTRTRIYLKQIHRALIRKDYYTSWASQYADMAVAWLVCPAQLYVPGIWMWFSVFWHGFCHAPINKWKACPFVFLFLSERYDRYVKIRSIRNNTKATISLFNVSEPFFFSFFFGHVLVGDELGSATDIDRLLVSSGPSTPIFTSIHRDNFLSCQHRF